MYIKVDPLFGEMQMQVYIAPFTFAIGGVDILDIRGVPTEYKSEAKVLVAKQDVEKLVREDTAKVVMKAALKKHNLDGSLDCTKVLCSSCARAFEGQVISVNCSMSPGYVIADILDGAWGEEDKQPEWYFSSIPGRCGESVIDTGDAMVKANRSNTIRTLGKRCRGRESCNFAATTSSMGNVWATENPLALSVIAVCADMSNAAKGWANQITDMYGFGCRDGCYTCATVGVRCHVMCHDVM